MKLITRVVVLVMLAAVRLGAQSDTQVITFDAPSGMSSEMLGSGLVCRNDQSVLSTD